MTAAGRGAETAGFGAVRTAGGVIGGFGVVVVVEDRTPGTITGGLGAWATTVGFGAAGFAAIVGFADTAGLAATAGLAVVVDLATTGGLAETVGLDPATGFTATVVLGAVGAGLGAAATTGGFAAVTAGLGAGVANVAGFGAAATTGGFVDAITGGLGAGLAMEGGIGGRDDGFTVDGIVAVGLGAAGTGGTGGAAAVTAGAGAEFAIVTFPSPLQISSPVAVDPMAFSEYSPSGEVVESHSNLKGAALTVPRPLPFR